MKRTTKNKSLPENLEEEVIRNLIKLRKLQQEALIKIMTSMDKLDELEDKKRVFRKK